MIDRRSSRCSSPRRPPKAEPFLVEPAKSVVRYHIVHKFHGVSGASSTMEGKAVLKPDGVVLVMVRVPMASFDSGERNRDADMRDAVEAHRFPFVVFKGTARLDGSVPPRRSRGRCRRSMEGEVELHGVRKPVVVPLTIELSPDGTARARGELRGEPRRVRGRAAVAPVREDRRCLQDRGRPRVAR